MSIEEQARAAAEREYGSLVPERDRGLVYPVAAVHGFRTGAYVRGYLAGHGAATRTREVTTVAELDALPVGSVVMFEDGTVAKQLHRDRWYFVGYNNPVSKGARMLYKYFPARVLYEPEEGR